MKSIVSAYFLPVFVCALYLFLYVPILVLIIFSFNSNPFTYTWQGGTIRWYQELLASTEVWDALYNSVLVAASSVLLSLTLGSLLVFYARSYYLEKLQVLFYGSLAAPEIVLAVGMLSMFSFFSISLGITTLIAGHTLIGLGYVVPIIYGRYLEIEQSLLEASYDLGATQTQTFWRVVIPLLSPALFASSLLVFIISLDDFVISFFCAGATTSTLPLYIFAMIRSGATPMVNAISTLLLVASSVLVLIFSSFQVRRLSGVR